jgi:hypothetical protein
MISLDSIPRKQSQAIGRAIHDEAVITLPEKGKVQVLNAVGASIWELCDGQRSVRQVTEAICREYAVESAQAEKDVLGFLGLLEAKGVISIDAPQA